MNATQMSKKAIAVSGMVLLAQVLFAAPHVTIDAVAQRWPWNNNIDIAYTVGGAQDVKRGTYMKLVFTATVNGTVYTVDGDALGASASAGPHTVTWRTAPAGIKATTLAMAATIRQSNVPSGDDYMIVDLATGAVTYEGRFATQTESNNRYNTDEYKTSKLLLRKVAAGGTYPTGDDKNYSNSNSRKYWTTDRDYFIGVFQVTRSQYKSICGTDPSTYVNNYAERPDNKPETRVVHHVSWNALRGQGTLPTATLEADANGTFLQRLSAKTFSAAGITWFDLPTDAMFEVAQRAGATTTFSWGGTMDTNYVVCVENMTNLVERTARPMSVGTRLPNVWGLYDTAGNTWEWCRDDASLSNLANVADIFTPAYASGNTKRITRGGGGFNSKALAGDEFQFRASWRGSQSPDNNADNRGFRVAWVRQ